MTITHAGNITGIVLEYKSDKILFNLPLFCSNNYCLRSTVKIIVLVQYYLCPYLLIKTIGKFTFDFEPSFDIFLIFLNPDVTFYQAWD